MATYKVKKITPYMAYTVAEFSSKKNAKEYMAELRRLYAKDLPRGSKRLCRWLNKDSIEVREVHNDGRVSGDDIIFRIEG